MRVCCRRPPVACFLLLAIVSTGGADPVFIDTFEDGDFTNTDGPAGLSWTVVAGGATVETKLDGRSLGLPGGTNCLVTQQSAELDDFTLAFDARLNWSNPARALFLYGDADNFYALGLADGNRGVYRRMDGAETRLYDDAAKLLRLPHDRDATNSFKIHVRNDGSTIRLAFDRAGDGRDYDVELVDTNAQAVARFGGTRFGVANASAPNASRLFHVDNVTVHAGRLEHPRESATYHVDAALGDDGRSAEAAQSPATPWRTIQRAADAALCGDTVLVHPGIYRETVAPVQSGAAGRPITYRGANPADRPVVDGSDPIGVDGWTAATITNFAGSGVPVWSHVIAWTPTAAFVGTNRLFAAQDPDQSNADDPYDIAAFRPVPAEGNPGTSTTRLVDVTFLTQTAVDYWKGATLLLYDAAGNFVLERQVTGFDPAAHALTTAAFSSVINPGDRYALRNHVGLLDQPGEFHVDTSVSPARFLVRTDAGITLGGITAPRRDHAFDLGGGNRIGIEIDGFEVRFTASHGVDVGGGSQAIAVRNCRIHRTMASGVAVGSSDGVLVSNCVVEANHDTGVNFGAGRNYAVVGCDISRNGNNGIWAGTGGGTAVFNTVGVVIRGNRLHHQGGRRSHADNYQMHQCDDVLIEGNVMVQDGHQNGWCQYTGHLTMRNNILLNGNFGVNSAMHTEIHHNAFVALSLRYDSHLTDHPTLGDYYKPQSAVLRDNVFVNTSLGWPSAAVVDRFAVFTTDHNYYNSDSLYTMQGWDWQGYRCGVARGGSLLLCDRTLSASGLALRCAVSLIWSEPARLVFLYKDNANFYAIGLASSNRGVYRRLAGQETQLHADGASLLRLPHASPGTGRFTVCATNDGTAVRLLLARDEPEGSYDLALVDSDPAAVAAFAGDTRVGLMSVSTTTNTPWAFIDDVVLESGPARFEDGFEDGDYTQTASPTGLTWNVPYGSASISSIASTRGVGYGEGSIVLTNVAAFAAEVVEPPDAAYERFDLHLRRGSLLRDAGVDVGVAQDLDGAPRPVGAGVDIGPYEYRPVAGTSLRIE